jgi:hypothetical protein
MRFPQPVREGSAAHVDAVRRLGEARDHECDMRDALEASRTPMSERAAARELSAARERTAAREAWVVWVERGF